MSCKVEGIPELLRELQKVGEEGQRYAAASVSAVADLIVADAKINAPADLGKIRQNISQRTVSTKDVIEATVSANAPESPFQEFGTGGKVQIPAQMTDQASAARNSGTGDFKAFVLALTGWVKRRGINPIGAYQVSTRKRISRGSKRDLDEATAYAIARSILKNGLKPQPFLYPAYIKNITKLEPMLKAALDKLKID